jgi:hypothetical protein
LSPPASTEPPGSIGVTSPVSPSATSRGATIFGRGRAQAFDLVRLEMVVMACVMR